VFLGTPEAAVPSLQALVAYADVVAVVTRPDQPQGRSKTPVPSPVKVAATGLGLPVLQPANSSELTSALAGLGPVDVGVVTAFGILISSKALAMPARGFLNVHFSLLPRWRGASPVVAAILAGDEETGVTIMNLDQGLDTGPIVAARTATIGRDETGGALTDRLAGLGAGLLIENLEPWMSISLMALPQAEVGATTAPKITKSDLLIDIGGTVDGLVRRIRALAPRPGAFLELADDLRLRILAARATSDVVEAGELSKVDRRLLLGVADGALELLEVQTPGKKPMSAAAWLRGLKGSLPAVKR
jgi:methionyl-tRNA formyltransferase